MLPKDLTGRRKEDALSAPLEKIDSKSCLEIAHLLRDVGLGNAQPIRCPAKASGFRYFQKVAHVPDFEGIMHHVLGKLAQICLTTQGR